MRFNGAFVTPTLNSARFLSAQIRLGCFIPRDQEGLHRETPSLLLVLRIEEICSNDFQALLLSPISDTVSLFSEAPMLPVFWSSKARVIPFQNKKDITVEASLRGWPRSLVYSRLSIFTQEMQNYSHLTTSFLIFEGAGSDEYPSVMAIQ
jgi:hypothetical protein